jgi:hypothetical protein
MKMSCQRHSPAALPAGKNPCTHSVVVCVGPSAGVDILEENLLSLQRPELWTIQHWYVLMLFNDDLLTETFV